MDSSIFTHPGFIGGMIGGFVGMLGGIFGTYCSYRKARSVKVRRWILFYAGLWLVFSVGMVVAALLAVSWGVAVWLPVCSVISFPLIFLTVRHLNRLHQESGELS